MFDLIFSELVYGFKRVWKLYLTNVLSVAVIVLLFAYIDGSKRQMILQNTAFSGEVVLKLKENPEGVDRLIESKVPSVRYVSDKIRSDVQFRMGEVNSAAVLVGVDLQKDDNLRNYLTLLEGRFMTNDRDILVPSSLLQKTDIKPGDRLMVMGKTAEGTYNTAVFKVCGIYNAPGLSLFNTPKLLCTYGKAFEFYQPHPDDVEHCVFYKRGRVPEDFYVAIADAIDGSNRNLIDSADQTSVSSQDVMNVSVQFNIFLVIMVTLTVAVIVTLTVLVNFNISMILFRKRQKEVGTLMSFGVPRWKVGLTYYVESVFQVILSTAAALVLSAAVSFVSARQLAHGFLEVLFVLLSGTNRIDFYIRPYQAAAAFLIILGSVTAAQIPIFMKIMVSDPLQIMSRK